MVSAIILNVIMHQYRYAGRRYADFRCVKYY
jgi:hypothetical protein